MERNDLIAIIQSEAPDYLLQELEYLLDIESDDEPDITWDMLSVLFDAENNAEEHRDRKMLTACRRLFIRLGFYREMTQHQIDNTVVSRGPVWHFKLDGVAYTTDYTADNWQFGRYGWNLKWK